MKCLTFVGCALAVVWLGVGTAAVCAAETGRDAPSATSGQDAGQPAAAGPEASGRKDDARPESPGQAEQTGQPGQAQAGNPEDPASGKASAPGDAPAAAQPFAQPFAQPQGRRADPHAGRHEDASPAQEPAQHPSQHPAPHPAPQAGTPDQAVPPHPAGEPSAQGIGRFELGMTAGAFREQGGRPTDNPDMLQTKLSWADAEWTCVVQFEEDKAVAVLLFTPFSETLLDRVFADLRERKCLPVTVQPGHPDLYQLSGRGKTDEECWEAMRRQLELPAAEHGACSVLFAPEPFFRDLASTVRQPAREEPVLAAHSGDAIYAVNIDRVSNQLTYLVSPWGYMAR